MKEMYVTGSDITKSKRLWMAIVLGSLTAIGPLSMDMYLPALPKLVEDLDSTASLVQMSLTACLLGMAGGQLLLGPLSDQLGRRSPLLAALAVYSIASLLCASASSIELLLFLRFIQGASGAGGIVIARAIVRDLYSGTEMTKFFALLMLINGSAPILAPIIGGQILQFTSWKGIFILLCMLSVIMLIATFFTLKETLTPEMRSTGGIKDTFRTFGTLISDRVFMGYALSQGFIMAAMFAYISGSPFVLQNMFGASPQTFSLVFAVNGVGIIIASQMTGRLAGKVEERKLLVTGLCLALSGSLLLLAAILLQTSLAGILPGMFLVVSSVGIVGTTSFSLAMQNQKKSAGSAAALLGLLPFVLGSIMAPLVGLGGEGTAVPMGVVIVGCELIAILSYFSLARRRA